MTRAWTGLALRLGGTVEGRTQVLHTDGEEAMAPAQGPASAHVSTSSLLPIQFSVLLPTHTAHPLTSTAGPERATQDSEERGSGAGSARVCQGTSSLRRDPIVSPNVAMQLGLSC